LKTNDTIFIATRGSALALAQSNMILAQCRAAFPKLAFELKIIKTTGDKLQTASLAKEDQSLPKGLFTKELEVALLKHRADLAVHSLKDLPTEVPAGLSIAAIPQREDARDALVGARLSELPAGAKVGTSSLRRAAQLRVVRPDLVIESVRGNLDTRVRKLDEGQYQAIVLAAAGLMRLGWAGRIAEILQPEVMCPAVGQGALAIETRTEGAARGICAALDHGATRAAVTAERAVLASLGGGCQVPIGAHAEIAGSALRLIAVVVAPDGSLMVRKSDLGAVANAAEIGRRVGAALLAAGAREILDRVYSEPARDAAV
jgi:hydroxymethylbilane synthase